MQFSDEQKEAAEAIFRPEDSGLRDFTIKWRSDGFDVTQMYGFVKVNLSALMKLAEIFKTKNIDTDQWASEGCPTCDFGWQYEVRFTIKPEEITK